MNQASPTLWQSTTATAPSTHCSPTIFGGTLNARLGVLIGNSWMEAVSQPRTYLDMAGEIGSMPFAYEAIQIETLAMAIEIFCERTERAFAAWQLKTHDGISQAYQAKLQAYEEALAQARAAAGAQIAGQNPAFNARIIANELRRQCLTLVTGQQFEAFGALELSQQGYAEPDLARSEEQMPYVRFFEQAFEWEHIVYFFYPYFWGWKGAWKKRMLLDDTDPAFGDFLRAGAARVVFPVRPGFEAAMIHYLETPDGEIWNGGPPPDISSSLYVPIVQEIEQATGAPGTEVPVGDPWEVRLPTTLVRLCGPTTTFQLGRRSARSGGRSTDERGRSGLAVWLTRRAPGCTRSRIQTRSRPRRTRSPARPRGLSRRAVGSAPSRHLARRLP